MRSPHPDGDTVWGFALRVTMGKPSAKAAERWERRNEVLAQWLLNEWQRVQRAPDQRDADCDTDMHRTPTVSQHGLD
jgi:hypothetical protein